MLSCCAGAELQVRGLEGEILLRELYPSKSDLFERARALEVEYRQVLSSSNQELARPIARTCPTE
jgi:hypothetical protein